ncbi:DUF2635 domain-containing protein [Salmonella enterica subsp. enterica serovar Braenderup]|nr:hypothetical protein CHD15_03735 [Salmonella enterica]EAX6860044.1 DUF2635 domain-containing protein [Salmonella enterica]ECY4323971.1 DUF2635 domain-containing protein [Salmonella enterica subsp. enterica serovar Enteritidis]EEE3273732.1 DUF2635 domain-containing protein [Salmonella enterica subsp. enterica serovar Braenderup]
MYGVTMEQKLIKPARENVRVRRPDGAHLSPEGERLDVGAYWRRREAEGDVVIADIPAETSCPETKNQKRKRK